MLGQRRPQNGHEAPSFKQYGHFWGGNPPLPSQDPNNLINMLMQTIPPTPSPASSPVPGAPTGPDSMSSWCMMVVQMLINQMAENQRREAEKDARISELERAVHLLRATPPFPPQQQQNGGNGMAPTRSWRPRQHWRERYGPLTRADNTPITNEYLDKVATLKEKEDKGESNNDDYKCHIIEHEGDLLRAEQKVKMQCISADVRVSKGVAAQFSSQYGKPPCEPFECDVGDVVMQDLGKDGSLLNIVTKHKAGHRVEKKPERFIPGVVKAIKRAAKELADNSTEEVAIPRLSSGLDGLEWIWVKDLLREELKDVAIKVHVYWRPPVRTHPQEPGDINANPNPPAPPNAPNDTRRSGRYALRNNPTPNQPPNV